MGCDIHPVLEKRWTNQETGETKWVGVHDFPYRQLRITLYPHQHSELKLKDPITVNIGYYSYAAQQRHYMLFANLAGVRGDGPAPRGLPDDISDLATMGMQRMGGDGHSHSWVTAREWIEACWKCEEDQAKLFLAPDSDDPRRRNPYHHYLELEVDETVDNGVPSEDHPDNFRIVFCFDN